MPILIAHYSTARNNPDVRRAIAGALVDLTAAILHKRPEVTSVLVKEALADEWFIGPASLAEHGLATFTLSIKVTGGTNTKPEFAAYIEAVHARMADILGPLHEASYVAIEDVPASAWGYGGRTQEERFIAGRLPAMKRAA